MTSTTVKITRTTDKKDVQKLQRAIIDGLEDVKAQDIQVFDTEHITALFERVIIATGTSNRQTKALAASVRDAVRDAGFAKPRIEGEVNGEWIIVDCGAAVAHIMQPTIRQYYHLEELWGDKPVKLKLGAPAPLARVATPEPSEQAKPSKLRAVARSTSKPAKPGAKPVAKKVAKTDAGVYVGRVGKTIGWTAKRNAAAPAAAPVARPARAASRAAVKKAPAKTPIVKIPATKKVTARKAAVTAGAKKPAVKKTTTRGK
ncbi:MAG: ribosome silencing factor [Polaromonas sp.]